MFMIYLLIMYAEIPVSAKLSENQFRKFLQDVYEKEASANCYKSNAAEYDYETDIDNESKRQIAEIVSLEVSEWEKETWIKYFKDIREDDYVDPSLRRQAKMHHLLGHAALDPHKLVQLTNATTEMTEIYSTAKVCPYEKQNCNLTTEGLNLEPDLEEIMAKSTDYDELVYIWKAWRDASGAKMINIYKAYVNLSNEAAKANNFTDEEDIWREAYEDDNFVENIDELWSQVEPLYTELHAYVTTKLKTRYGQRLNVSDGLIPAHVLGNMWAQDWSPLEDLVRPFPNASRMDVDEALKEQGYSILDLFTVADEFFQSLGLLPMGMSYNESAGSMIRSPTDGREVLCHPNAWDFCDGKTYRLKMCTQVTFEYFKRIHHELGHIQYFMLYKHQPIAFREGANPGFHETIGDTMALSVSTPKHLQKMKLLKNYTDGYEETINYLMQIALSKVAFLPFGLLIDKWRWDVFNGTVPENQWNTHWWTYRKNYQKVKPPVSRSDKTDFDPGGKFHVAGDAQYIAYFLAHILQFKFYRSLCITAGEYDPNNKTVPLHKCDFYQSVAAGNKLRVGLELGSSKHWSETLEILTGVRKVSAEPVLEYFEPLYKFLITENKRSRKKLSRHSKFF